MLDTPTRCVPAVVSKLSVPADRTESVAPSDSGESEEAVISVALVHSGDSRHYGFRESVTQLQSPSGLCPVVPATTDDRTTGRGDHIDGDRVEPLNRERNRLSPHSGRTVSVDSPGEDSSLSSQLPVGGIARRW